MFVVCVVARVLLYKYLTKKANSGIHRKQPTHITVNTTQVMKSDSLLYVNAKSLL